ncbi:MAG TPA: 3-oxoacyl-[acyl-carrier-protein] synthase III C-terminal domain-containing protein [Caulobacteraceae bacterium]|nr:3-oxoacyl-[acyl-carrier-protein] synthase III C-terminal domain-containing protein [Caulobacteraceae bacterium]
MPTSARLLSVASASPPHEFLQEEVSSQARRLFGPKFRDFERLFPVFRNTGIRSRQAVLPMEWYFQDRSWPERTAAYLEGAVDLFCDAAGQALSRAGLSGADIDTIVTISSTGIATPSLEARAMDRLGFRQGVARVPVFGLGCAGGVSGLSIASRLAQSRPGSIVLLVAVELCTLACRLDEMTSANIVATALFGDGAAACVVRAGPDGVAEITGTAEHTWPDSLDIMGWNVDPLGFGVIFDRSIPTFAETHLRPAMECSLSRMGMSMSDVDRFVCHPGGAKVIEALEKSLDLGQGALTWEREVLADHGNMSAPTVMFVLERALAAKTSGQLVLTALGPGFTASCVSLAA